MATLIVITKEGCSACLRLKTPMPGSKISLLDQIKEWLQPYITGFEHIHFTPMNSSTIFQQKHPYLPTIVQQNVTHVPAFLMVPTNEWKQKISPMRFTHLKGAVTSQSNMENWAKQSVSQLKTRQGNSLNSLNEETSHALKVSLPESPHTTSKLVSTNGQNKPIPKKIPTSASSYMTTINL